MNKILQKPAGLIDPTGRPIGHAAVNGEGPKTRTPEQEVSRMIRKIEAARITGGDYYLGVLLAYAQDGWKFIHQNDLQTNRCEVTIATHINRDIHGKLHVGYERIVRLGDAFLPALKQLQDEALDEERFLQATAAARKDIDADDEGTPPASGQAEGSGN